MNLRPNTSASFALRDETFWPGVKLPVCCCHNICFAICPVSSGNPRRTIRKMRMIQIKRAYEEPARSDGKRILVERLWPRGLTKERARIDLWLKEIAPSPELRKWFAHDPAKWKAFGQRYRKELADKKELLQGLRRDAKHGRVTLIYGARDEQHNSAVVLKSVLQK